jgi:putative N6-adenine-specific DNA methylase
MLQLIATTAFGLEAVVKREVTALGYTPAVSDGRVAFAGDFAALAAANLWLRSADRVWIHIGDFPALSFDELFEGTKALPWADWIPQNGKFTVTGKSVRSALFSVPDCQSIVKKAIVEKLKQKYPIEWFTEDGPAYTIQISILKDRATLCIDTTGQGLHKRGYREKALAAPLRETTAAALIALTYWNKDRILLDPFCGSGTIPIEAALMAKHIAPGLNRRFACESWPQMSKEIWKDARARAYAAIDQQVQPEIYGSDIDPAAVSLAQENAELAGVGDTIRLAVSPIKQVELPGRYGIAVCNPPYAERMGTAAETEALYRDMRSVFGQDDTWSVNVITADEFFESAFGRKADAKRKLFNATIKTDYYQYVGKKPPYNNAVRIAST